MYELEVGTRLIVAVITTLRSTPTFNNVSTIVPVLLTLLRSPLGCSSRALAIDFCSPLDYGAVRFLVFCAKKKKKLRVESYRCDSQVREFLQNSWTDCFEPFCGLNLLASVASSDPLSSILYCDFIGLLSLLDWNEELKELAASIRCQ
jgi:hypothetical protein